MAMPVWSTAEGGRESALGDVTRIGRADDNDVSLLSPCASAHYATLRHERGLRVLEDNHSTNGTLVNGRRIRRPVLQNEDTITIGGLTLVFRNAPPSGASTLSLGQGESDDAAPARDAGPGAAAQAAAAGGR